MSQNKDGNEQSKNKEEMEGFLHNLSNVKDNRFEFCLQTKRKTHRVVCFAPNKRALLEDMVKSPVRLSNYKISSKSSDIILTKSGSVESSSGLDFKCAEITGQVKICNISKCAIGQLIHIKAMVTQLKDITIVAGKDLRLRESVAVDETGTIKLLLWEDHCDKIQDGLTYNFINLRVKEDLRGNIIVNTAKQGCIIESINPFSEELCQSPILTENDNKINGEIIAVDHVSKIITCCKCNKEILDNVEKKISVDCASCHMKQKVKACKKNIYVEILIRDESTNVDKTVTIFKEQIKYLVSEAEKITPNELAERLLELPPIQLFYSASTKVVKYIQIQI